MSQIILDFQDRPKLGWSDFEIGPANQTAIEWLIKWPNWPKNGLAIHGDAGCGKTHLGNLWMRMVGAKQVTKKNILNVVEQYDGRHFLIDGADVLQNAESSAFHLINIVKEQAGSVLILDRKSPFLWKICLQDLSSRLLSLNSVHIRPPDETLLTTILVTQLKSRGIVPEPKSCKYAIERLPRTFDAILDFVKKIDIASLQEKRSINFCLMRAVLDNKP
ncbi:MAG: hypothetical protein LBI30_03610 [Holosporales bacterium]|jgi:chromosomal replication initiation ATPase DnaA|nr:hypothetical protein [Holosporales bacterium]